MSYAKWKNFVDAHKLVKRLREEYNIKSCGFKCIDKLYIDENLPLDRYSGLYGNDFSNAVCVDDNTAIYICDLYDKHDICVHKECPNHAWNKQYVDLANKLNAAKQARKRAFRNLFVWEK